MPNESYIVKVHRQHRSLVCTIPKKLAKQLDVAAGDSVIFKLRVGAKYARMSMLVKGVSYGVQSRASRNRQD